MKRKEVKKCNNKVFRSSKSEEFFGISQEYVFNIKARKIVKIKTDISEEMKGVKYCEYER